MSGLAGLNKSPSGMVLGLVQLQLPVVETPAQLASQAQRIVDMVGKARRSCPGMDLVVFPEYALHGPEVAAFKAACVQHQIWGCFSIMEKNPGGNPYNTGLVIDDQANAFQNLMVKANVCLCGSDGTFDSMGEAMVCNFDGTVMSQGGGRPDEIVCAEIRSDLIREARVHWGVENNPYQLYRRGYVAVKGGAQDCPYTFMPDMVTGRFKLPWEGQVVHTDGQSCGFAPPTRTFEGNTVNLLDVPASPSASPSSSAPLQEAA